MTSTPKMLLQMAVNLQEALNHQTKIEQLYQNWLRPKPEFRDEFDHEIETETDMTFELISNQLKPKDVKTLIDNYKDLYAEQEEDEQRTGLTFPSREAALNFFQHQADLGLCFMLKESGKDFFVYSNGNGQLFAGTQDELDQHLAEEQQASNSLLPRPEPRPECQDEGDEEEEIYRKRRASI